MINSGRKPEFFQTRAIQNRIPASSQINPVEKSNIGETKRLKVQTFSSSTTQNWPAISINPKTWPNLKTNDLIEISAQSSQNANHLNSNQLNSSLSRAAASSLVLSSSTSSSTLSPSQQNSMDDDSSPFLVNIMESSFNEQIPLDNIRIEQAASQPPFSIKNLAFANVTIVDKASVMLDLVEVTFKEQYINGYDMLRIKKSVENSCIYLKKNIEFCLIRCSVKELWSVNGDNVTCGYVGEKTRFVFRSQSAMCLIYIQMSREMWEFDVNGEMYHEKAINFLSELFTNWKNQQCTHDVTIALFSRVYYDAKSTDEFPSSISADIKIDHKNRFYEDYYRVVYQNERFEDWTPTLVILKRLIKEYRDYVLNYHSRQLNANMPSGSLSSAAEGNFLQTLNLSSRVFERHFIDRPFDRAGMMSLVITPGNGIYEVEKEMAKITKERVIDNGIGSDLVCLGEQPLHAVPLFKYDTTDAFNIPNWMNLSFYQSSEMVRYCNSCFLPRSKIKLKTKSTKISSDNILPDYSSANFLSSFEESDKIFDNNPTKIMKENLNRNLNGVKNKTKYSNNNSIGNLSSSIVSNTTEYPKDDNDDADIDSSMESDLEGECGEKNNQKINPFMPNQVKKSRRLPWAHIFPLRNDGSPIFPHKEASYTPEMKQKLTNISNNLTAGDFLPKISPELSLVSNSIQKNYFLNKTNSTTETGYLTTVSMNGNRRKALISKGSKSGFELKDESIGLLKTGVAWKSLTIPALFPLTIDYTPSEWAKKYQCASDYTLLLETIREEYCFSNYQYNQKITMSQVFIELVGHRLAMGFQIVVPKNTFTHTSNSGSNSDSTSTTPTNSTQSNLTDIKTHTLTNTLHSNFICDLSQSCSVLPRNNLKSIKGYYRLSLGRIFHELFYIVDPSDRSEQVKVEIYVPISKNKTQPNPPIEYKYRFQVPDSKTYDISYCEICRTNIESIKWNYIDRYISIQGNGSLTPSELEKCWRQRLYLLPIMYVSSKLDDQHIQKPFNSTNLTNSLGLSNLTQSQIPASMVQNPFYTQRCDIFHRKSEDELLFYRDYHFIKFMEGLNKLNRADDRRLYSRSTVHYIDLISSQSSLFHDQVQAVSAITVALTQNSTQTNLNKSPLSQLPNIPKKSQANQTAKLPSPKIYLLHRVAKYLQNSDPNLKSEITTYLINEYQTHMLNQTSGIPFIQHKNDIPLYCFVSAEAVWWCIENIIDCTTESDAILIMQIMIDFEIIKHISRAQKLFIHGFYLYYFITNETLTHELYTKDYCEVGFVDIESHNEFYNKCPLVSCKHLLPECTNTLPISSKSLFESYINLFKNYSNTRFANSCPDGILKLVNVDVDPTRKSNRVEWASAVYRSHYHQLCAFELEVQWEVATCSLLSETVNCWAKLSNRYNYHIIPAPIDPFALPLVQNSDPLRGPIYILLNLRCIISNNKILFQDIIDEKFRACFEELFNEKYSSSPNLSSSGSISDSSSNGSSIASCTKAELMIEYLNENYPEFLLFLYQKYDNREDLERKLADVDFIRTEIFDFVEYERIIRLISFQEAILEKFGFIRNSAVVKSVFTEEDHTFFIHASGGMFVQIPNYYNNYSNRSRHPSSNNNFLEQSRQSIKNLEASKEKLMRKDLVDGNAIVCKKNPSTSSSTKISFNNSSNGSSYSQIPNQIRERTSTKSQHMHFLILNEKNYLVDPINLVEKRQEMENLRSGKNSDEVKNDLLFKPKSGNPRISAKIEKIDQIQHQHQKEQMLLQNFGSADQTTYQKYMAQSERRKIPFYDGTGHFIGFFWSWNFMLGKKWRSQYTGDEQFQDNMLSDFRLFCSNQDGRLEKFFKDVRDQLK